MYCSSCGSKMPDGARFCVKCGAPAGGGAGPAPANPAGVAPEPARAGLRSRLVEFRRTTLRAVPTFVLAIVAFLAAAGVAYAFFRVAVDVVVPAAETVIENVSGSPSGQSGRGKADNSENGGNNGGENPKTEEGVSQAKGEPDSFVQLGELLSMKPGDIAGYLSEQGMVAKTLAPGEIPMSSVTDAPLYGPSAQNQGPANVYGQGLTTWRLDWNREALEKAGIPADVLSDDAGSADSVGAYAGVELVMGTGMSGDLYHAYSEDASYATENSLANGTRPTQVTLSGLRLTWLDEQGAFAVAKALGFDSVLGTYRCVSAASKSDPNSLAAYLDDAWTVYSGAVETEGTTSYWAVFQHGQSEGLPTTTVMCVSGDDARRMVVEEQELYTADEWSGTSNAQRCEMLGQALIQGAREPGDGPIQGMSLRTGEVLGDASNQEDVDYYESSYAVTPESIRDVLKSDK